MFREMRRHKQKLEPQEIISVLERNSNGVLACLGDNDYPYAVPMSYTYKDQKIFFHCAKEGHKIDAILKHPKVSFAVVDADEIVGNKFTTYFRSAIVFGQARLAYEDERLPAFRDLVEKYSGDVDEADKAKEIAQSQGAAVVVIEIEHMSGKEAIELVRIKAAKE